MRTIEFWLLLMVSCGGLGGLLALYFMLPDYWYREEWWMEDRLRNDLRRSAKQTRAILAMVLFVAMALLVVMWTAWIG